MDISFVITSVLTGIDDDQVINPFTLLTEKEMAAITAARFPPPPPDYEADDYDWTVALSTYDFLEIEANKHATARVRIPWKVVDHLREVKEEQEAFAAWCDQRRQRELARAPETAVAQDIEEVYLLDYLPRQLFEEAATAAAAKESGSLDGVLAGVQGLGNMVIE